MPVSEERLKYLFQQYESNECTEEELKEFFYCVSKPDNEEALEAMFLRSMETNGISENYDQERWDKVLQKAFASNKTPVVAMNSGKFFTLRRIAAAAVILVLLSAGGYWLVGYKAEKAVAKSEHQNRFKNDVSPGGNRAILILADGTNIILDSAANGTLTQQGNTKIIKSADGQLAYNAAGAKGEMLYNTISTPRGGEYQVVLPDGTKVWLNSASSIKFPVAFTGNQRKVEMTGEAYFEVSQLSLKSGKKMPFIVSKGDMLVEVLGTHFNVNAYDDEEKSRITLLEGSVKVSATTGSSSPSTLATEGMRLKPGEQAEVSVLSQISINRSPNIEGVMAWKNGFVDCNGLNIASIMRQVSRWYDVDIFFKGSIPSDRFVGRIPRTVTLVNLLKVLELNGFQFRIEGKKIIVL